MVASNAFLRPLTRTRLSCVAAVALWLVISTTVAYATVILYVDNTSSSCPGNGGPTTPFCSIKEALKYAGNDTIIEVRHGTRDGTYREAVNIDNSESGTDSGAVGHPFVLRNSGLVTIDGADTSSRWTQSGNFWRSPVDDNSGTIPLQVYINGARYNNWPGSLDSLPYRHCKYLSAEDNIYVNTNGYNMTGILAYISVRTGIKVRASNVTVQGFTVRRSNDDGINGAGNIRNCTFTANNVQQCVAQGIMFGNSTTNVITSTIQDNISCNNGSHGIYLLDNVTDCAVLRNTCSANDKPDSARGGVNGIRIGSRTSGVASYSHHITVEGNYSYGNEDTGIEIRANEVLSRYNQSYKNQDHGFDHLYCTGVKHIGDLAWGNARDGMSFETTNSVDTLRNCVIADNAKDTRRYDYEIETFSGSRVGWVADNNVIWRPYHSDGDDVLIHWNDLSDKPDSANSKCVGTGCYASLNSFKTDYPTLEQHSRGSQPLVADSLGGDFKPLDGSSVIDKADAADPRYLSTDVRGFGRHNYLAIADSGLGTPAYADIGPYEFDPLPGVPNVGFGVGYDYGEACWTEKGDDDGIGDTQSWAIYDGSTIVASGAATGVGTGHDVTFSLLPCSGHGLKVRTYDANQWVDSNVFSGSTCCSPDCDPSAACPGLRPSRAAQQRIEEDVPLSVGRPEPNPAFGTSDIEFSVPRVLKGANVEVYLFDVSGRRVSTVAKGIAMPGRFSVAVPFRSDHGASLQAGIYFLRFRIGNNNFRRTVVLAR